MPSKLKQPRAHNAVAATSSVLLPIVNLPAGDRLVRAAALLLTAQMARQDLRNGSGHRHGRIRRQAGSVPPQPTAPTPLASMARRRGPGTGAKRRLGRTVVQVARSQCFSATTRPTTARAWVLHSLYPSMADMGGSIGNFCVLLNAQQSLTEVLNVVGEYSYVYTAG